MKAAAILAIMIIALASLNGYAQEDLTELQTQIATVESEITNLENLLARARRTLSNLETKEAALLATNEADGNLVMVSRSSTMYSEPDEDSKAIAVVPAGRKVLPTGDVESYFYKVVYGQSVGWVSVRYLEIQEFNKRRIEAKLEEDMKATRDQGVYLWVTRISTVDAFGSGKDFGISIRNIHPTKTVKYLSVWATPYNSVGDKQPLINIDHEAGRLTGPIEPGESTSVSWELWHLNPTITCAEITRIEQEYMDGTKSVYVRDIPKVLRGVANDCSYKGN